MILCDDVVGVIATYMGFPISMMLLNKNITEIVYKNVKNNINADIFKFMINHGSTNWIKILLEENNISSEIYNTCIWVAYFEGKNDALIIMLNYGKNLLTFNNRRIVLKESLQYYIEVAKIVIIGLPRKNIAASLGIFMVKSNLRNREKIVNILKSCVYDENDLVISYKE